VNLTVATGGEFIVGGEGAYPVEGKLEVKASASGACSMVLVRGAEWRTCQPLSPMLSKRSSTKCLHLRLHPRLLRRLQRLYPRLLRRRALLLK